MFRSLPYVLALSFAVGVSSVAAQTKKAPAAPGRNPSAGDKAVTVNVFMRDGNKNELLVGTRIWPGFPDYNAAALQRFFAVMKALEPAYRQDDEVAYTWSNKARVTKCSIYLESPDAGSKNGTGATVGCEANGVSGLAVPSVADPKSGASASQDPRHINDVLELFKKQSERAKSSLSK
jgi:hypothetical protein